MDKNVYITKLSSFLPNEPVENDEMEDSLGYIGGHSSRIKRIILSQNQIKQRYYAIKGDVYKRQLVFFRIDILYSLI